MGQTSRAKRCGRTRCDHLPIKRAHMRRSRSTVSGVVTRRQALGACRLIESSRCAVDRRICVLLIISIALCRVICRTQLFHTCHLRPSPEPSARRMGLPGLLTPTGRCASQNDLSCVFGFAASSTTSPAQRSVFVGSVAALSYA